MKKITLISIFSLIFIAAAVVWMWKQGDGVKNITPVSDRTNGIQEIKVSSPAVGTVIISPLTVQGEARGVWYFEGSFPVRLMDEDGKEISLGIAQAQGDWMTSDFVPFSLELKFDQPLVAGGYLIFEKDNPSGLPENAGEYRVPISFSKGRAAGKQSCVVTGCSNQLCADEEVASTCEYREEYSCYRTATCERQENGECGWTETEELASCLESLGQ